MQEAINVYGPEEPARNRNASPSVWAKTTSDARGAGRPQPRASLCLQHRGAGTPAFEIPKESSSGAVSDDFPLMLKYSRSRLSTVWALPRPVGATGKPRVVARSVTGASFPNPDAPGQTLRGAFPGSFSVLPGETKMLLPTRRLRGRVGAGHRWQRAGRHPGHAHPAPASPAFLLSFQNIVFCATHDFVASGRWEAFWGEGGGVEDALSEGARCGRVVVCAHVCERTRVCLGSRPWGRR